MPSANKVFNTLLDPLAPRQKEVILLRFGLDRSGEGKTLAAIGDRLNLTRERVRQIENSAMELISESAAKNPACSNVLSRIKKRLKGAGGTMKQEDLLNYCAGFADGLRANHLMLLSEASGAFYEYSENDDFWTFYYLTEGDLQKLIRFIDEWANFLEKRKQKVLEGSYKEHLRDFTKAQRLGKSEAENYLGTSKMTHSNPYGDVGLKEWPEINPLTTRDRAYIVLKKKEEPLHFEAIADAINEVGFEGQLALAPTVHNELIKDPRFVLVGRGTYGLREHGYEPGIAREVIQKVLKRHGPLKADDVVERVSKQRLFKQNTVIINLQNKNFFERLADGRYRVRES